MTSLTVPFIADLNPIFATRVGVTLLVVGVLTIVGTVTRTRKQARRPLVPAPAATRRHPAPSPAPVPATSWDSSSIDFFGSSPGSVSQPAPSAEFRGWSLNDPGAPSLPTGRPQRGVLPMGPLIGGAALIVVGVLFVLPTVLDMLTVRHVTVADHVGAFSLMPPTGRMATLTQQAEQELASAAPRLHNVQVGFYERPERPQVPAAFLFTAEFEGNGSSDSFFRGMSQGAMSGGSALSLSSVDPGRFGGDLRCGTISTASGNVPMCAWADSDTLGMMMFFPQAGTQADDISTLARTMREATET